MYEDIKKRLEFLPDIIQQALLRVDKVYVNAIQEIRLRVAQPISLVIKGESYFLANDGLLSAFVPKNPYIIDAEMIKETFLSACGYSVHSHTTELASGFVTTAYGDRVGICGRVVLENGVVIGMRDITSINIRISRQVQKVAQEYLAMIDIKKGVLIVGAPSTGKTTLLRDIVRAISCGEVGFHKKVALIDQRYELAAIHNAVPQYELGACTDIISGQGKAEAIEQAVRTLSPDIIACDEIGSDGEVSAIVSGSNCGAGFLATAHCGSADDLYKNIRIKKLIDTGVFGYIIRLTSVAMPCVGGEIITMEEYKNEMDRTTVNL